MSFLSPKPLKFVKIYLRKHYFTLLEKFQKIFGIAGFLFRGAYFQKLLFSSVLIPNLILNILKSTF